MSRGIQSRRDLVDGVLLLNKPAGLTSNQALQRVKRLLNAKKAGHTGSLDPAATGMLPLCFGEATKVCAFLLNADKTYRVTARLGVATDTGDADGEETAREPVPGLTAAHWREILTTFLGESMQIPPMYSALKKDGRRLYELARRGETVERAARPIRIDACDLLEHAGTRLVFRVRCTKGTYVRALVEDIAKAAGTVAHTSRLHRETVADFDTAAMLDLPGVEATVAEGGAESLRVRLLPADSVLGELPSVSINEEAAGRFRLGRIAPVLMPDSPSVATTGPVPSAKTGAAGLVRVYGPSGPADFLGVGELVEAAMVAPKRVFASPKI